MNNNYSFQFLLSKLFANANNKLLCFIVFINIASSTSAQYIIENSFRPFSFQELLGPVETYNRAYNEASGKLETYFEKAQDAIEKGNYTLAKSYLNRCIELNNQFRGNLCSNKDLIEWVNYCDKQLDIQAARNENRLTSNPSYGIQYQTSSDNESCRITNILIDNKLTVIEFDYTNLYDSDGWCNIEKDAYIIDRSNGNKLNLLWAEGIPTAPERYIFDNKYETLHFKLFFPAVSDSAKIIDMIEYENSSWNFYNINLNR